MLYACASLSFYRLCHAWHPLWARSCLVTPNAHEALFGCDHLGSLSECRVVSYIPFPFRSVRCYAYHVCSRHPLAFYASLHACSLVHAWVLLANVSSMLQHNEVMDIQSKPTFVPCRHHLCLLSYLFAFLLVCLLTYLLAFLFLCLPCLLCLSALCLFHMLFASFPSIFFFCWFLVFTFACTHMERGRIELGHGLLSASKKGEDASMWI